MNSSTSHFATSAQLFGICTPKHSLNEGLLKLKHILWANYVFLAGKKPFFHFFKFWVWKLLQLCSFFSDCSLVAFQNFFLTTQPHELVGSVKVWKIFPILMFLLLNYHFGFWIRQKLAEIATFLDFSHLFNQMQLFGNYFNKWNAKLTFGILHQNKAQSFVIEVFSEL